LGWGRPECTATIWFASRVFAVAVPARADDYPQVTLPRESRTFERPERAIDPSPAEGTAAQRWSASDPPAKRGRVTKLWEIRSPDGPSYDCIGKLGCGGRLDSSRRTLDQFCWMEFGPAQDCRISWHQDRWAKPSEAPGPFVPTCISHPIGKGGNFSLNHVAKAQSFGFNRAMVYAIDILQIAES
jgi:hypothetical protein